MDKKFDLVGFWGDADAQVHDYLQDGLKRMPLEQRQVVGSRFIRLWCETCIKENNCPILLDVLADKNRTEWKVTGGFPFCEDYQPVGNRHE